MTKINIYKDKLFKFFRYLHISGYKGIDKKTRFH